MARISKHGAEIGTVHLTSHSKKYMSDGKILVNRGFGWKLGGKIKTELASLSPQQLYRRQLDHLAAIDRERPVAAAFRKELHAMCCLSKRWKLLAAIQLMPDDPDGVWSECCDGYGDNISADVDDIVQLCRLYKSMESEAREKKAAA